MAKQYKDYKTPVNQTNSLLLRTLGLFCTVLVISFFIPCRSARASTFTTTDSCGGNSITWIASGVENLYQYSSDNCMYQYYADFKRIGDPVTISATYAPATGQFHDYGFNSINGIFMPYVYFSQDYCESPDGLTLPTRCSELQPLSVSYCYSGVWLDQLWMTSSVWNLDVNDPPDYMTPAPGGIWITLNASSRSEICTGTPEECLYAMKTKHKGAGT